MRLGSPAAGGGKGPTNASSTSAATAGWSFSRPALRAGSLATRYDVAHPLENRPLMPPRLRGKWALGITPRNFTWILKDKLAICERPGGVGDSHRRVRRQEEIIWLRENGFNCVISIVQATSNLHNYEELNLPYRHRPFRDDERDYAVAAHMLHSLKVKSINLITNNPKKMVGLEGYGIKV